jgi:hypothetical protein
MPRPRLFVPLPSFPMRAMLLIRRQPLQAASCQDAVDRRAGDRHLVESLQVVRDPTGAEVIVLAQIQNLADHLVRGRPWEVLRRPRAVA